MYLAHRVLVWNQIPRPAWVRFYLDDLLCLPIILTVALFLMRFFFGARVRLSKYQIGFAVLYVALVFEVILPLFMPRYTGDFFDVLLYAGGGWFFYFFLNK
ncbi:hypothetical protein GCM10011405_10860 [Rufibacter glacialis]|nr:hypothetical protein GCM10011405_10860 [Rufibacter glacialis]